MEEQAQKKHFKTHTQYALTRCHPSLLHQCCVMCPLCHIRTQSLGDTERQAKHSLMNNGSSGVCGRWTKPSPFPTAHNSGCLISTQCLLFWLSFMHQPYVTWIRKWLVMLGFTWDENSGLSGKSHVRDLPFNSNLHPLWVLSRFGKNITLWHLLNLPIIDMDGFTLLVH